MIPKKIHYCWIGGNPLPKSAKKCIASWKKYCPDYEIIEWNETNYDFTKNQYMKEALEAKKWGFVPDFARLDIIYQHGGIYLDTDVEIVKSFDPLLKNKGFAGFESEENVNFGQGFGAEPGNKVIKELMDSYEKLRFKNDDGSLNMIASPKLNTDTLVELGLKQDNTKQELIGCFSIYPIEYFCPKAYIDGVIRKTENTFSIHHFDASWFPEEWQEVKKARWEKAKKKQRKEKIKALIVKVIGENTYKKNRGTDKEES